MGKVELGPTPASQNQDMGRKETAVLVSAFTWGLLSQTPNSTPANGESLEAQENERNIVALPGDPQKPTGSQESSNRVASFPRH